MTKTTQMKIIHLLEEHTDNQRKIALLRYELQHPATITPTEMLEAMSFAKGTGEGKTIGSVSDKTHHRQYRKENGLCAFEERRDSLSQNREVIQDSKGKHYRILSGRRLEVSP